MQNTILARTVTYDFARLMENATQVSCSGFGQAMISQCDQKPRLGGVFMGPDSGQYVYWACA